MSIRGLKSGVTTVRRIYASIDNVLTSSFPEKIRVSVFETHISDHAGLFVELKSNMNNVKFSADEVNGKVVRPITEKGMEDFKASKWHYMGTYFEHYSTGNIRNVLMSC